MPFGKIDREGMFLPFAGITIICKVNGIVEFLISIQQALQNDPLIKQYYSTVPSSSHHMTAINLYTQDAMSETEWKSFLHEKIRFFSMLNKTLHEKAFPLNAQIVGAIMQGVIQLIVCIPSAQKEKIEAIATKHQLAHKIPQVFHITLAYQYKAVEEENASAVNQRLSRIIDTYCHPGIIFPLSSPALYYFQDMTAYKPLDIVSSSLDGRHLIFSCTNTESIVRQKERDVHFCALR